MSTLWNLAKIIFIFSAVLWLVLSPEEGYQELTVFGLLVLVGDFLFKE